MNLGLQTVSVLISDGGKREYVSGRDMAPKGQKSDWKCRERNNWNTRVGISLRRERSGGKIHQINLLFMIGDLFDTPENRVLTSGRSLTWLNLRSRETANSENPTSLNFYKCFNATKPLSERVLVTPINT